MKMHLLFNTKSIFFIVNSYQFSAVFLSLQLMAVLMVGHLSMLVQRSPMFPTGVMTSTFTDVGGRGEWVPDPAQLMCSAPGMPDRSHCI